jgi:hypothetical protein
VGVGVGVWKKSSPRPFDHIQLLLYHIQLLLYHIQLCCCCVQLLLLHIQLLLLLRIPGWLNGCVLRVRACTHDACVCVCVYVCVW